MNPGHTPAHADMCAVPVGCTDTVVYMHEHACTSTHAHTQAHTYAHAHNTHTQMHMHTYAIRTCTRIHIHTYNTRTYAHTCAPALPLHAVQYDGRHLHCRQEAAQLGAVHHQQGRPRSTCVAVPQGSTLTHQNGSTAGQHPHSSEWQYRRAAPSLIRMAVPQGSTLTRQNGSTTGEHRRAAPSLTRIEVKK